MSTTNSTGDLVYPLRRRVAAAMRHMLWGTPMPAPAAPPVPPVRAGLLNTGELVLLNADGGDRVILSAAETDLVRDVLARDALAGGPVAYDTHPLDERPL